MLNLDGFQLILDLGAVGQVAQNQFLCRAGFYKNTFDQKMLRTLRCLSSMKKICASMGFYGHFILRICVIVKILELIPPQTSN